MTLATASAAQPSATKSAGPLDALALAVEAGRALAASVMEGTNVGQFPAGSRARIEAATSFAAGLLEAGSTNLMARRAAAARLNDTLMEVETTAHQPGARLCDPTPTGETRRLYERLGALVTQGQFLFGMHDATSYGLNADGSTWRDDGTAARSDLKSVGGAHGAIFSWDIMAIAGQPFETLRDFRHRLVAAHELGGVNTLCWHMQDPVNRTFYFKDVSPPYNVVAALCEGGVHHAWFVRRLDELAFFAKGLRDAQGRAIPIIFRPFHEHNGDWFWWGRTRCSEAEYIALWRFTVRYLRDVKRVSNFIYAFSPDGSRVANRAEYLYAYPGDEFVDVLGLDYYGSAAGEVERARLRDRLMCVTEIAQEKEKVAALTEIGDRVGGDNDARLQTPDWFTSVLLRAITDDPRSRRIAYAALWRNADRHHHFAPYPGHPAVPDFLRFITNPAVRMLDSSTKQSPAPPR